MQQYTIPKRRWSTAVEGNRYPVKPGSREEAEIWDVVRQSCLDDKAIPRCWKVRHTTIVRLAKWQEDFQRKRQELKEVLNNRDPKVTFAFGLVRKDTLADNVCEYAAFKVQDLYVPLGDLDQGVNLSMHADVLMAWARKKQYSNPCLIIYKILKGRVKSLKVRLTTTGAHFDPSPNHDCHVLREMATDDADELEQRMINSQIFVYEYDDECLPVKHPRHCLPYAVICFNRDTSLGSENKKPASDPAMAKMWLDHVERNDKLETLRKDNGLSDRPSEESEQDDQVYPDHTASDDKLVGEDQDEIFAADNHVLSKEQIQLERQAAPPDDSHGNIDPESSDYSDVCLSGEESANESENEFHMESDSEREQLPYQLNDQSVDNGSGNEDDDHACTDKSPKPDSIKGNLDPESSNYSDVSLSEEESLSDEPERDLQVESDGERNTNQMSDNSTYDSAGETDDENDNMSAVQETSEDDSIKSSADPESSNYSDVSLSEEEPANVDSEVHVGTNLSADVTDQDANASSASRKNDTFNTNAEQESSNYSDISSSCVESASEQDKEQPNDQSGSTCDDEIQNSEECADTSKVEVGNELEAHGTSDNDTLRIPEGFTSIANESHDNPQFKAESQKDALFKSENSVRGVKSLSPLDEASDMQHSKQCKTLTKGKRRMSRQKRNEQAFKRKPSLLDMDSDTSGDDFSKHEETHPGKLISAVQKRKRKNAGNHIYTDGKHSPPTQKTGVSVESCPDVERKPRKRCISTYSRGTSSEELGNEKQPSSNGNAMLVASDEDIFANSELSDHASGVGYSRRVGRFERDSESSEPGSSSNKLENLCDDDNNNSCETGAELDASNVCSRLGNIPSDVNESNHDPPIDITGHDASAYSGNMHGGGLTTPSSKLECAEKQYQEAKLKLQWYRLMRSRACEAQLDELSAPTSQQDDGDLVKGSTPYAHHGNMATDVPEYESDWSGVAFSPCSLSDGETGDKNGNNSDYIWNEDTESDDFDVDGGQLGHLFKSSSDTRHCKDMLQVHPSQSNADDLEREVLNSDCNLKRKESDPTSKSPEVSVETASNSPQFNRISNVKDDHATDHEINGIMSTPYANCGDEPCIDAAENESDWSGVASSPCSPDQEHCDSNNNEQVVEDLDDKDSVNVNILNDNGNEFDESYTCVDVPKEGYMSPPSDAVEDESNYEGNESKSQSFSRQLSITESKEHAWVNINTEVDKVRSILDNNKPPVLIKNAEVNVDGVSNLCDIDLDVPFNEDKNIPLPHPNRDGQSAPRQIQGDHPARRREHREIHGRMNFSRKKGNGDRGRNFRRELKSRYGRNFEHKKDLNLRQGESRGKYQWTGRHSTHHQNYHREDNFNRFKTQWPKYYDTKRRKRNANGSAYSRCIDRVQLHVPSLKRDQQTGECVDEFKIEPCKVVDYNHGILDAVDHNYGSTSFRSPRKDAMQWLADRATLNQALRTDFAPPLPKDPPPLKPCLPSVSHEPADKNLENVDVDMDIDMNRGHQETVIIDYFHGNNTAPVETGRVKYNKPFESTEKQLHVTNFAVQEVQSSVVLKTTTITSPACSNQINSLGERNRPNNQHDQQQGSLDERRMEVIRCLQEEMDKTTDPILKKAFELSINRLLHREPLQPTTQNQSLTSNDNTKEEQGHKHPSTSRPEVVACATSALPEQADTYSLPRSTNEDAIINIPLTVDPTLPYDKRPSDPRRARPDLYGQKFEVDVSPVNFKSSKAKLSRDSKNNQRISCSDGGIPQRPGEHLTDERSNSKPSGLLKSKKESQNTEPLYVSTSIADVISSTPVSPDQEETLLNRSVESGTLKQCTPLRSRTAELENSVKGCRDSQVTTSVSQLIEEALSENPSIGKGNRGIPFAHASVKGMNEDAKRVVFNSSKEQSTPTSKRNVILSGPSKEIGTVTQDTGIQSRDELKNTPPDLRSSIEEFKRTRQSCGDGSERNICQDAQTNSNKNISLHSDNISTGSEDKLISAEKSDESNILTVQAELHQKTYTTVDDHRNGWGSITTSHTSNAVSDVDRSIDQKVQLLAPNNECDENVDPGSYHHKQRKAAEISKSDARGKKRKPGALLHVIAKKRPAERNDDSVEEIKSKSIKDTEIDSIFSRLSELKRTLAELDQKRAETHKRTATRSNQSISDHTFRERQDQQIDQINLTAERHVQIEDHVRQNGRHRGQDRRQPGHSQNRGTSYKYSGHYERNGHRHDRWHRPDDRSDDRYRDRCSNTSDHRYRESRVRPRSEFRSQLYEHQSGKRWDRNRDNPFDDYRRDYKHRPI